jgi:hypothetical protein
VFPRVIEVAGPDDKPVLLPAEPQRLTGRLKRIGAKK